MLKAYKQYCMHRLIHARASSFQGNFHPPSMFQVYEYWKSRDLIFHFRMQPLQQEQERFGIQANSTTVKYLAQRVTPSILFAPKAKNYYR